MKNTAAKMNARENSMRNPNNSAVAKPAKGKPKAKLVIAIGVAPTLGSKSEQTFNKTAQRIRK